MLAPSETEAPTSTKELEGLTNSALHLID